MLINSKINTIKALKVTGIKFSVFFFLALAIGLSRQFFGFSGSLISTQMLVILGSGVGVFLAFRINSGYDRWWEARKIWGELLIDSRSFGMSITSMLTKQQDKETTPEEVLIQKEILYAHIGYVNALRLHLRKNDKVTWNKELWEREVNQKHFFQADEVSELQLKFNIPTQIIQLQSQKINKFYGGDLIKDFRYLHLIRSLQSFIEIQGRCERIKNTVFPWGYSFYTHRLAWLMALLLPFGCINAINWADITLCALISTVFVTIEQVGRNLDNPFEDSFNDTPMSALSRLIEIDLLEQLGEPRTEPFIAENGILK